ncbi:MAG: AgmX/PglI C-terminal domain-containing protein [Myxococcota bacterium]
MMPSPTMTEADLPAWCAWTAGNDVPHAEQVVRGNRDRFAILEATATTVRYAGEDVLTLNLGRLPPEQRRKMISTPLYDTLLESAEMMKAVHRACGRPEPFRAEIGLAIDPGVPFETTRALMYTAGQSQFSRFYLLTGATLPAPAPAQPPPPDASTIMAVVWDEGIQVHLGEEDWEGTVEDLPTLVSDAHRSGSDQIGCGLFVPKPQTPWGQLIGAMDLVAGQGTSDLFIGGSPRAIQGESPPLVPARAGHLLISPDTILPVLTAALPQVSPFGAPSETVKECAAFAWRDPSMRARDRPRLRRASRNTRSDPNARGQLIDGPLHISAGLDRSLVEAILHRHRDHIRSCYQQGLDENPSAQGALTLSFQIDLDGMTGDAVVSSSTLGSEPIERCVLEWVHRMIFPAPRATVQVEKTYTFAP